MVSLGRAWEEQDDASVLRGQEGSLMDCMQWQGLRAEMSRGHRIPTVLTSQPLHQVPGGKENLHKWPLDLT